MMGSGKTSIGSLISKELDLDFYDIDQQIEIEFNSEISKIFRNKGEKFFRDIEEKTTLKVLKNKNIVIALGGGAFLNRNIRNEILKNHISIWLRWDSEIIIKRIKNNPQRPIAFNSTKSELLNLIKKRSNIYLKALYTINCDGLTKKQIVDKILNIYENNEINC